MLLLTLEPGEWMDGADPRNMTVLLFRYPV